MDVVLGLVLVALALYFSTLSYALRDLSRTRVSELLREKTQRLWLGRLDRLESEFQVVMSTVRLTTMLLVILWVYYEWLGDTVATVSPASIAVPTLINAAVLLIFALAIPHALGAHAGDFFVARSLPLIWVLRWVLFPVERVLMGVDFIVRRLLGKADASDEEQSEVHEQEILEALSEGELAGALDEEQKEMIESVFELHETQVSTIMKPRTDIIAIDANADYEQVRQTIIDAGHSRMPVYEGSLDHIVGVLYAKDLFRVDPQAAFDVRKIMRGVPFVPESKPIDALLRELRQKRVHIAIVLDEYGGTAGLVTIEDIIEEVVGEIDDEYDATPPEDILRIDDDTLEVAARVPVYEINEELDIELPEDGDYETIGGFVSTMLGHIPTVDEQLTHKNVHVRVLDSEPRKINRLRIHVERNGHD